MWKYTVRLFWRHVRPLLGARTRRRIARVGFVLLQITCGFVLRPRHEVYYKNAAKKVAIYGTLAILIFVALRLVTAYLL